MYKVNEIVVMNGLKLKVLNFVETPLLKITLFIVLDDHTKTAHSDDTDRFYTECYIKENEVSGEAVCEAHFDVEHIYANLLTYGINPSTIDVLMERELGMASFSVKPTDKEVLKTIKKSERDADTQDLLGAYWETIRPFSYSDILKEKYKKRIRSNFK